MLAGGYVFVSGAAGFCSSIAEGAMALGRRISISRRSWNDHVGLEAAVERNKFTGCDGWLSWRPAIDRNAVV